MINQDTNKLIETGDSTSILPLPNNKKPVTVIGNEAIRQTFGSETLKQAINSAMAPGVSQVVLNPDAHVGYGAPVGCVMSSPSHIYPGPVGVDIKCSMSLLAIDIDESAIRQPMVRRRIINAICERTPTGTGKGQRDVPKARSVSDQLGRKAITEGASQEVCEQLGIPVEWAQRCEDSSHVGFDGTHDALERRFDILCRNKQFSQRMPRKIRQLGSYGGGNHFGECEVVRVGDTNRAKDVAQTFGLVDGNVAFLSHCGSRGFGHDLASGQFRTLQKHFEKWDTPLPGGDRQLVYAPLGTHEANNYIDDMSMGANFATVNHMLINALVLEAFQEIFPGVEGRLVYFISHNIARQEVVNDRLEWVHRKGATRAFPAGHHELKDTPFAKTGHPILLPGNPQAGSAVMVADQGAEK